MDSEAIEEAAARWVARRDGGEWTDSEQEAFDAWLGSSLLHRIAYIRLESVWQRAARMKALGAGVPSGAIPPRRAWADTRTSNGVSPKAPSESAPFDSLPGVASAGGALSSSLAADKRRRDRTPVRLAAIAVSLLVIVSGLFVYIARQTTGDQFWTPVGGTKELRLADGSRVTLNTDTMIRVSLGEKERHVDLVRGEAFFEVAKDARHPFIVYAGDKRVMAVGTAFSVRRDSESVEVVVTEGKVQLATAPSFLSTLGDGSLGRSGKMDGSATNQAMPPVTVLLAGSIARTAKTEVVVHEQAVPEVEDALSWRAGSIVFRDTTLEQAVAEFNRYNTRKIIIGDPAIASMRIGGNFHSNNTEAFLALIQSVFPIRIEEGRDRVVLRAR